MRAMPPILAALLFAAPALNAAVTGPVAVLPFKNLSDDSSLAWMSRGISETMATDLRTQGKVTVVEREMLDGAIREIGRAIAEDDGAIRAGKLVGAKVVVVGSYQKAGDQLRINARFVEVQTGVVLDAVKATGPAANPFAVQDDVVAKLAGAKPARKAPGKQVAKAYELYAQALETGDDVKKREILKKAVEADPSFTYAEADLVALELRLGAYRATNQSLSEAKAAKQLAALREEVFGTKHPPEHRNHRAVSLLIELMTNDRWAELAVDAKKVEEAGLPPFGNMDLQDMALSHRCLAHTMLGENEVALQLCEQYMKQFPEGTYFELVENQIALNIEAIRAGTKEAALDSMVVSLAACPASHRQYAQGTTVKVSGREKDACVILIGQMGEDFEPKGAVKCVVPVSLGTATITILERRAHTVSFDASLCKELPKSDRSWIFRSHR